MPTTVEELCRKHQLTMTQLIERSGLDRTSALEVLTNGAPGSPLVKAVSIRMTTPDFTPNFLLRLMAKDLDRFAAVPIDASESRYRYPLELDAKRLAEKVGPKCEVVLLGSVATGPGSR